MQYLADTVAIVRYFAKAGEIGKRAKLKYLTNNLRKLRNMRAILRTTFFLRYDLHTQPNDGLTR